MERNDRSGRRRRALKEISGGLLPAAASSVFAQQETRSNTQAGKPAFMPDFPTEYPKPIKPLKRIRDGKNDR
jgi:hypothetical protein